MWSINFIIIIIYLIITLLTYRPPADAALSQGKLLFFTRKITCYTAQVIIASQPGANIIPSGTRQQMREVLKRSLQSYTSG